MKSTSQSTSKPEAVGVHIFAGGFSLGMKQAGFRVRAHFEASEYGVATSKANHPELDVWTDPGKWEGHVGQYQPDVVFCNPPCAPWSAAGSKVKGGKRDYSAGADPRDPRVACFHQAFGFLKVRPKVLAIESVTRLWTAGRALADGLIAQATDDGYETSVVLHDGLECGLPQRRKRVFLVFHRVGIEWARPSEPGPRTVREAFADLLDPDQEIGRVCPEWAELIPDVPPGGRLRDAYMRRWGESRWDEARGVYGGRPGFLRRRLKWDAPSPTVTGDPCLYHPEENRVLSVREAQVLCGYPADYEFVGAIGRKYAQIAQAVTPPVGRWLGKTLIQALKAEKRHSPGRIQVHDFIGKEKEKS